MEGPMAPVKYAAEDRFDGHQWEKKLNAPSVGNVRAQRWGMGGWVGGGTPS